MVCSACGLRKQAITADDLMGFPLKRPFSAKQRRVLVLVCNGLTNTQIADHMKTTEHTIRNVLTRIYAKVGFCGRTALLIRMLKFKYEGV
jgi:DNA-binding NarL/FixJ family response regulator